MDYFVKLDVERIRLDLERVTERPQTNEHVVEFVEALGLRRRDEVWFWAKEESLVNFLEGEVLEKRPVE